MGKKTRVLELHDDEYRALAEFRYQLRRFLRHMESEVVGTGLNSQQYQVLLAIKGLPKHREPTIAMLAERLQLNHNIMVELVDRCQDKELVLRHRLAKDRRNVVISLTSNGESFLRKLASAARQELNLIGPLLINSMKELTSLTNSEQP